VAAGVEERADPRSITVASVRASMSGSTAALERQRLRLEPVAGLAGSSTRGFCVRLRPPIRPSHPARRDTTPAVTQPMPTPRVDIRARQWCRCEPHAGRRLTMTIGMAPCLCSGHAPPLSATLTCGAGDRTLFSATSLTPSLRPIVDAQGAPTRCLPLPYRTVGEQLMDARRGSCPRRRQSRTDAAPCQWSGTTLTSGSRPRVRPTHATASRAAPADSMPHTASDGFRCELHRGHHCR
jgi:hypothetical protein